MSEATKYEKYVLPSGAFTTRAINPARRAKKALGLSGRQYVKYRKAQRRAAKAA